VPPRLRLNAFAAPFLFPRAPPETTPAGAFPRDHGKGGDEPLDRTVAVQALGIEKRPGALSWACGPAEGSEAWERRRAAPGGRLRLLDGGSRSRRGLCRLCGTGIGPEHTHGTPRGTAWARRTARPWASPWEGESPRSRPRAFVLSVPGTPALADRRGRLPSRPVQWPRSTPLSRPPCSEVPASCRSPSGQ